jgi:ataxin-10
VYPSLRSDILATIGNLSHRRLAVQTAFCELGAVEAVLSNCVFDPLCPGVREWALWAVRNLCEGNLGVQERIRSLRPSSELQDEALRALGKRIELDQQTGRFRLVNDG